MLGDFGHFYFKCVVRLRHGVGHPLGLGPVVEEPHDEELLTHAREFAAACRRGNRLLYGVGQRRQPGNFNPIGEGGLGVAGQIAVDAVDPDNHLGTEEPVLLEQRLGSLRLFARCKAAGVVAPLVLALTR